MKRNYSTRENVITANEGNAIALAAGYYLSTGKLPLVYMQNSGMGNSVNPLVSLADRHVYSIPMILLIGWRGEPGTKDGEREQHIMQGKLTEPLLEDMEIPFRVISDQTAQEDITWAATYARGNNRTVALIAPNNVLTEKKKNEADDRYPLSREEAISIVLDVMPQDTLYVASTGRATRELFCQREIREEDHSHDFLNIGSMGHGSSVAMGLALGNPNRKVVCLDGDAAAIMHMGAMTTVSKLNLPNFIHIILNNGAHESVGGQPSAGQMIDFTRIAEGCGYYTTGNTAENEAQLRAALHDCIGCGKASFVDARIHSGIRSDLHSIAMSSHDMIEKLMKGLR